MVILIVGSSDFRVNMEVHIILQKVMYYYKR